MKSISYYINEALKLGKPRYKYHPKTKKELQDIISQRITQEGNEVDLNDIDVSNITDMSGLFKRTDFNGNISKWNVSNVKDMHFMFDGCTAFNQDISNWDVSNVTDMSSMFFACKVFNQDISKWDVSNVTNMDYMFYRCKSFNKDISNWNVSNVKYYINIFSYCKIEKKYKPKFK